MPVAISFVTGASSNGGLVSAANLSIASQATAGDLHIAAVAIGRDNFTITATSGWTLLTDVSFTGQRYQVYYKVLNGTETTFGWTFSGTTNAAYGYALYRGVDNTQPFDVTFTQNTKTTASTTAAWPAITTVTNGAQIVRIAGAAAQATTGTAVTINKPVSPTSTERFANSSAAAGTLNNGIELHDFNLATAGTTAAANGTESQSCNDVTTTIALKPANVTSFVAATSANSGSSIANTLSVTMPTIQANDVAIAAISIGANSGSMTTPPSGYTLAYDSATGVNARLLVYYKVLSGSESGTSLSFTYSTTTFCAMGVSVYRNVSTTNPLDVSAASSLFTASTTTFSWPALATVTDNSQVIRVVSGRNASTSFGFAVNLTSTTETTLTERIDTGTSGTLNNVGVELNDYNQAVAGTVVNPSGGYANSATGAAAIFALQVQPTTVVYTGSASGTSTSSGSAALRPIAATASGTSTSTGSASASNLKVATASGSSASSGSVKAILPVVAGLGFVSTQNKTSANTTTVSTSPTVPAGSYALIAVGIDPLTSGVTLTDNSGNGNVWKQLALATTGTTTNEITVVLFGCQLTAALPQNTVLSFTWGSGSPAAKAIVGYSLTGVRPNTLVLPQIYTTTNTSTSGANPVSLTGLTYGDFVVAAHAAEDTGGYSLTTTPPSGYQNNLSAVTFQTFSQTSGGNNASNAEVLMYGWAYDGTSTGVYSSAYSINGNDNAAIMVAFRGEVGIPLTASGSSTSSGQATIAQTSNATVVIAAQTTVTASGGLLLSGNTATVDATSTVTVVGAVGTTVEPIAATSTSEVSGQVIKGISFVGAAQTSSGATLNGANTLSVTMPTIQANDVAFIVLSRSAAAEAPTSLPSGFNLISTLTDATEGRLYYKVLTGSESGSTLTISWTTANYSAMALSVYRGVDPANVFAGTTTTSTTAGAASTSITFPSVTVTDAFAEVVRFAASRRGANGASYNATPPTSPLHDERADTSSSRTNSLNAGAYIADYTPGAVGATGTAAATSSVAAYSVTWSVSLRSNNTYKPEFIRATSDMTVSASVSSDNVKYRGGSINYAAQTTTLSTPAQTEVGDLMFIWAETDSGITSLALQNATGWTPIPVYDNSYSRVAVYYKRAEASDLGKTWTVFTSNGQHVIAAIAAYYGVATSGEALDLWGQNPGPSGGTIRLGGSTSTLTANSRFIAMAADGFEPSFTYNGWAIWSAIAPTTRTDEQTRFNTAYLNTGTSKGGGLSVYDYREPNANQFIASNVYNSDATSKLSGWWAYIRPNAITQTQTYSGTASGKSTSTGSAAVTSSTFGASAIDAAATVTTVGKQIAVGATTIASTTTLTVVGAKVVPATPELIAATSTLTAVGLQKAFGATAIAAQATVSTAGFVTSTRAATIDATSTLAAYGTLTVFATDLIGSTASVTANGLLIAKGLVTLDAAGTVDASGTSVNTGTVTLAAASTLDAVGSHTAVATATLAAFATATTVGLQVATGTSTIAATSTLTSSETPVNVASAAISVTSSLSVAATQTAFGASAVDAASTLAAAGLRTQFGASAIDTAATVSAAGTRTQFATDTIGSSLDVTVSGLQTAYGTVFLNPADWLYVSGTVVTSGASAIDAGGTVSAAGSQVAVAASTIDTTSTLSAAATQFASGTSTLSGASTVTVAGVRVVVASESVDASTSLTVDGIQKASGQVALDITSTLLVGTENVRYGMATITATSDMAAVPLRKVGGVSLITSMQEIAVTATVTSTHTVALSTTSGLSVDGTITKFGSSTVSTISGVQVAGTQFAYGASTVDSVSGATTTGVQVAYGTSTVAAATVVTTAGVRVQFGASDVSATSTLDVAGFATSTHSVTLGATSDVTVAGLQVAHAASAIDSAATVSATAVRQVPAASLTAGTLGLSASGWVTSTHAVQIDGSASLSGTAERITLGAATLAAESDVSALPVGYVGLTPEPIAATSDVQATGSQTAYGAAALQPFGNVSAEGTRVTFAAAETTATSSVSVSGSLTTSGSSELTTSAALSVDGIQVSVALATISSSAMLQAYGFAGTETAVPLETTSDLTVAGQVTAVGATSISGTSDISAVATRVQFGVSAVAATSGLAVVTQTIKHASSAIAAATTFNAAGLQTAVASSTLGIAGGVTPAGVGVFASASTISAQTSLDLTGGLLAQGITTLTIASDIEPTATMFRFASALLAVDSTLTASEYVYRLVLPVSGTGRVKQRGGVNRSRLLGGKNRSIATGVGTRSKANPPEGMEE